MKFTAASGELLKGLSKVFGVVPTKSTLPLLENVLFELEGKDLKISATDLEIYTTVNIEVKGTEDGSITVPAKRIVETIRALEETSLVFQADTEANKVTMITETGEYNITGTSSEEYPQHPEMKEKTSFGINTSLLRKAVNKTFFAVSRDELRPSLTGVLFRIKDNSFTAVSTDGHRLVKFEKLNFESQKEADVIVPAKAVSVISKIFEGDETTITLDDKHIRFSNGVSTLTSVVINEIYPNYDSVIPIDNDKELIVSREQIISALRRVSLYANMTTHQVRFSVKDDQLTISAEDVDLGNQAKENVLCSYKNEPLEIGFNANYINDVLVHIDDDNVKFRFSAPTRAGIIEPENQETDENLLMLTMPLRLNN